LSQCFCVEVGEKFNKCRRCVETGGLCLIQPLCCGNVVDSTDICCMCPINAHPVSTSMDLGLKLQQLPLVTSKEKYLLTILPYHSMVRYLIWIVLDSHPDIQYAISYLSQFLNCYSQAYYDAVK
jgi:hypothetical protein